MTLIQIVNLVLQIILVGSAIPVLRASGPYQWVIKLFRLKMTKPLDCVQCLTTWTSLGLHFFFWETEPALAILASLSAGFIAEELEKLRDRI